MSSKSAGTPKSDLKLNSRVLALEAGMYIFRYASKLPEGQEVCITLQQAPVGKGSIDFFPAEGVSRNTLIKLGDCVVIRVKGGTGSVLVTEYHLGNTVVPNVDLRVDRIDTSENIMKRPAAQPTLAESASVAPAANAAANLPSNVSPLAIPRIALSLEGHIERRGDVTVTDTWLGNPDSTARLEGFSISWPNKPQDADLAYSCQISGLGRQPAAISGNFVGTRRKAAAIQAVTFGLIGPQQKSYQLSGQVVFAGCAPQNIVNGKELRGPTGSEHLVAVAVSISAKGEAAAPAAAAATYQSPWEDPAITQIYKAQG